jgi:arabinose-5-phosphate isomerase
MENHIISTGKNVIDLQIKALKKLKNSLDSNFEKAIKKIIKCKSKVIICGVGKSLNYLMDQLKDCQQQNKHAF